MSHEKQTQEATEPTDRQPNADSVGIVIRDSLPEQYEANHKYRNGKRESGGAKIDFATFCVLFVTMFGVFWYAEEAKRQTAQLILDGRPVLMTNGAEATIVKDGVLQIMNPRIINFGKTVAKDVTPLGHIIFGQAGNAPHDPDCLRDKPPPKAWKTALGGDGQPLNRHWGWEQGPADTNIGYGPVVYVVGCVYYKDLGDARFYSDICMTWNATDGLLACPDPNRNTIQ